MIFRQCPDVVNPRSWGILFRYVYNKYAIYAAINNDAFQCQHKMSELLGPRTHFGSEGAVFLCSISCCTLEKYNTELLCYY